jgi:hypothetical protein
VVRQLQSAHYFFTHGEHTIHVPVLIHRGDPGYFWAAEVKTDQLPAEVSAVVSKGLPIDYPMGFERRELPTVASATSGSGNRLYACLFQDAV